jgi:hypothetical protein
MPNLLKQVEELITYLSMFEPLSPEFIQVYDGKTPGRSDLKGRGNPRTAPTFDIIPLEVVL